MRATACFSMYSDMSSRTNAFSSSNRNSASARAVSVFPTPVGPRKMNDPVGRLGSCSPARGGAVPLSPLGVALARQAGGVSRFAVCPRHPRGGFLPPFPLPLHPLGRPAQPGRLVRVLGPPLLRGLVFLLGEGRQLDLVL